MLHDGRSSMSPTLMLFPEGVAASGITSTIARRALLLLGLEERREAVRDPCWLSASFEEMDTPHPVSSWAILFNVSPLGGGFLTDRPVRPGTPLSISIVGKIAGRILEGTGMVIHCSARGEQLVSHVLVWTRKRSEEELNYL